MNVRAPLSSSVALVRPVRAVAYELRYAWARGLRVSLTIDGDDERVEGHVRSVSPTDAFVVVGDVHVPLGRVLAVHRPSRLGDTTFDEERETWRGRVPGAARRDPRQLSFDGL